jgi:hypothetical protein
MTQFAGVAHCRPMPGGLPWNCMPFQDRSGFESGQGRQRTRLTPNAARPPPGWTAAGKMPHVRLIGAPGLACPHIRSSPEWKPGDQPVTRQLPRSAPELRSSVLPLATSGERRLRLHLIDIDRATEADLLAGGAGDHASYPCRVMPLIRPRADAGRARTRCSRSVGRTRSCNGPTTVGPETARITPIITAAPGDRPSSSAATAAASGQVISTPMMISLTTLAS